MAPKQNAPDQPKAQEIGTSERDTPIDTTRRPRPIIGEQFHAPAVPETGGNQAQAESDASPDATPVDAGEDLTRGQPENTSDSSGLNADQEVSGAERRKLYRNGAKLVSRID